MCGIFGGIGATKEQVRAALQRIHRGNDGITVREYGDLVLGSRRHMVKESAKANVSDGESDQPYESADGKIHLVFNGELYNFLELRDALQIKGHKFETVGDTEVFLHLYQDLGLSFVDQQTKISSLFALAVFDETKTELLITRDWPGRIPLFYFYDKAREIFLFSSELKGFEALDFLTMDQPVELQPGTMQVLNLETFSLDERVCYKPQIRKTEAPLLQVGRELHEKLQRSARHRTHGDVPICTMLSGGIDSIMTTYYVLSSIDFNRVDYHPTSYVYGIDDYASEDVRRAKISAAGFREIGLILKEIRTSGDQLVKDLPDIIYSFEMRNIKALSVYPLPIYYYLAPAMHKDGFKVTIGGHGVDELLGAYDAWKELNASHKAQIKHSSRLAFMNNIYENMLRRASVIFMNRGPIEARFPFLDPTVCEYALGIDPKWLSLSTDNAEFLLNQTEQRAGPRSQWTVQIEQTYDYLVRYLNNNGSYPEDASEEEVHEMEKLFWKLPLITAGMHASEKSFLPFHVLFNPKLRGQHGSGITSLESKVVEFYRDLGETDGEIFKKIVGDVFNLPPKAA